MLSWIRNRWTSLCLLITALGAFLLFLYGFFPLKYHSGKLANIKDLPNFIDGVSIDGQLVYNPGENSVVLMVIDSLRYDFVTEEYMPFTAELLKNKSACIYVSIAEPPTVTMPRIKSPERKILKAQWRRTINFWRDIFAMMTGSVSTFADVALNFGAPAVRGDSVLRVAAANGLKSIMYGDDTWLRLFPGLWTEYDGTTSFYVTDYTEVDNNVTRHLDKVLTPNEKNKPIFDFLVLHYLGLDHIGHLEGARSPKIKPKLLEMDEVVKKIFTAMRKWDRTGVLFISGDHGMRDAGGHGGATTAEVLVPLVVAKTTDYLCPYPSSSGPTVAQVDLAPTVSWLLNAPPPGDSTGSILPSLLPKDMRQHLYLLHVTTSHNARQPSMPTDAEFYKQFLRAEQQFARYLSTNQESAAKIAKEFYEESLVEMAKYLNETTVKFDMFALVLATVLLYFIVLALFFITLYSLQPEQMRKLSLIHHKTTKMGTMVAFCVILTITTSSLTLACFITETKSMVCSFDSLWGVAFILIACVLTMTYFIIKTGLEKIRDLTALKDLNAIDYLLIFGTVFHAWSFFGTSFIEEEHMTWYFFWNTLMLFVLVKMLTVLILYIGKVISRSTEVEDKVELARKMFIDIASLPPKWILLLALHRYLKTMNQTGDRWLFLPDTADWLNEPEHAWVLQAHLLIGTMATLGICLWNLRFTNNFVKVHSVLTIFSTLCVLAYRIATSTLNFPFADIATWDTVAIVSFFWASITAQFVIEILSYIGIFKWCGMNPTNQAKNQKFDYIKPKAKTEDYFYDSLVEEPWNLDDVKLNLARSISHLMLNNMMLTIILLMRPHNVIMVPSIFFTCVLTSKCLDHKLLDTKRGRNTDIADVLSLTLSHLWIGAVFFFYQGNSNSLASVDLGSGYVGLREYCPVRVAARMGLHAYAGPALAGGTLFCTLTRTDSWARYRQSVWRACNIFAFQRVYTLVIYSVIAIFFRHHLFVWSVFSPKLLYDFVGTVFTIQAINTILQIIVLTHVTSWIAKVLTYKSKL